MPRQPPGPTAPFLLYKSVGALELLGGTPPFRSLAHALDWAQRWLRDNPRPPVGLVCKRGYIVQFRVAPDGFVTLGEGRRKPPVRKTSVIPPGGMTSGANIAKVA